MSNFDWVSFGIASIITLLCLRAMQNNQRKREDDARRQAELMMRIVRHKTEKKETNQ